MRVEGVCELEYFWLGGKCICVQMEGEHGVYMYVCNQYLSDVQWGWKVCIYIHVYLCECMANTCTEVYLYVCISYVHVYMANVCTGM